MRQSVAESSARTILPGVGLLLLSGCAGPYSILDPASDVALRVSWLAGAMLSIALVITALVCATWWWASKRRALALDPEASERWGLPWLIGGGLVLPGVAITLLIVFGLPVSHSVMSRDNEPAWQVEVTAQQWAWHISYPALAGHQAINVIHVPAGAPIDFIVRTRDVIHSFWVPRLGGKIDAIPGHTRVWRLQADAPGVFHGLCSEYCGVGHDHMTFTVVAHDAEAFEQWQAAPKAAASTPLETPDVER